MAYHPQTDSQSERTNQMVKIVLQYHLTSHSDKDFTSALPYIQVNDSWNASTGYAPIKLAYSFCTNDSLSQLADLPLEDFTMTAGESCENFPLKVMVRCRRKNGRMNAN